MMVPQDAAVAGEMDLLQHAFRSFDQAAATLQHSYQAMTTRLERMDLELAERNDALRRNLAENEEMRSHLSAILESLATGVVVADQSGRVVRCNRAAEVLLGAARQDLIGRRLDAVVRDHRIEDATYPIASPRGLSLSVTRSDLRNSRGEVTGGILLIHDITAVRQLEERVQRRDRLASMGEMVGRIAHEIRNPLGSVELFASMLRQDLRDDPARRQYTEHISLAVETMDRLLANLLICTKPIQPRRAWHDAGDLIRGALALAAHAVTRPDVTVATAVRPEGLRLWGDASQLRQVLVNLFVNAGQAMPSGGTLTIDASREGEPGARAAVRLSVSDTGAGIASEHRSRLFDPFFTTREQGTGLGLAIVHAIVDGHGGRIDVDSEVGRGTTFTLLLPCPDDADAADRAGHESTQSHG